MKKIAFFILSIMLVSCGSENLSNSRAKKIIQNCLKQKPEQRTATVKIGKATFRDKDYDIELLAKYSKLTDDGYLEMKLLKEVEKGWNKRKEYSINLTKKALNMVSNAPENGGIASMKTFRYEVDKVMEVHETPSLNIAQVKVNYKAVDITPFAILSNKNPNEFWIDNVNFIKTSNGWKFCETID